MTDQPARHPEDPAPGPGAASGRDARAGTGTGQAGERVAVVTGGAQGIGWATADELASRGFYTVILDKGTSLDGGDGEPGALTEARQKLLRQGHRGEVAACDVRDPGSCREVMDGLGGRFGGVDVIVNVAGILRPGPFLDDTPEIWDLVMSTHVGGHLNVISAALPSMTGRPGAQIVNVTSTAALLGSRRQPAYSVAKEAVIGLTRLLARQLAPSGVTVNAVSPSATTRMSVGLRQPDGPGAQLSPALSQRDPADVGAFIGWLTSEEAAGVTGRVFMVSGRYIVEYDELRPYKWAAVPAEGGEPVADIIRWVLGRPHPTAIGPWPTRDFRLVEQERQFEGTTTGPVLADAEAGPPGTEPADEIAVAAGPAPGSVAVTAGLTTVPVTGVPAGRAAGAVVYLGLPGQEPDPGEVAGSAAQCRALTEGLGRVQAAIRSTRHHESRGVVVVLPGEPPWAQPPSAGTWVQWHGAVGLVRGGAATEGIYGVRVNGLVVAPGSGRLAPAVTRYLLSPESAWLNGYIVTVDADGVGVVADERPAWQVYTGGAGFRSLIGRSLLQPATGP